MPLIPYPNVPALPGVPSLPVPPIGYQQPVSPVDTTTLLQSSTTPSVSTASTQQSQWAIQDILGNLTLVPDSVIDFDYRNERKIPNYPIEQGAFSSYNKVALPYEIRMTVACNGNGEMTRNLFISTVQDMLDSLDLFTIVTPDEIYENANLIHANYNRTARQGVTLLLVELVFEEVRQTGTGTITTATPSGQAQVNNGQLNPVTPTPIQNNAITSTPIQ